MVGRKFPSSKGRRRQVSRACMESLDARTLFDIDVEFEQVTLPATGQTILQGQQIQIQVDLKNVGTSAFKQDFTIGAQLFPYAYMTDEARLNIAYGAAEATNIGSVVFNQQMAGNGPVQSVTMNVTVPIQQQVGTYALVIKLDTTSQLAEGGQGKNNNEGGMLDVQVLSDHGLMQLVGTGGNDTVSLTRITENKHPYVVVSSPLRAGAAKYSLGAVTQIMVLGLDGDDTMSASGALPPLYIDGYNGNDRIVGADNNDTLIGGANKDTVYGGLGNDRLNGNGGNDRLFGEGGADRLYGYDGQDYLDGGSSGDRLEGGAGLDTMLGQSGDDKFFAKDTVIDQVFGSSGTDPANIDASDVLSSVETTTS